MARCIECGFLCVRNSAGDLAEVPDFVRRDWDTRQYAFWDKHHQIAICLACALPEEERQVVQAGTKDSQKVIEKERECASFMEWQQGLTPKEHREMQNADRLREWQRKIEEADRAYRDEQRQKDLDREERWRREERGDRDKRDKDTRRQFWLTLIIGMILIPLLAAILQIISK
jgi:hypothetical protein